MLPGESVRERRVKMGFTQEALARIVSVSRQTIHDVEHGSSPRVDLALDLADALGTTVEELWPR